MKVLNDFIYVQLILKNIVLRYSWICQRRLTSWRRVDHSFPNYFGGSEHKVFRLMVCPQTPYLYKMVSPRGPFLGPILFTIYINDICHNFTKAKCHFYADNTVLYCSASSLGSDTEKLQSAFNTIQGNLHKLRLVLNSDKTKIMCFSKSRKTDNVCQIVTLDKRVIERVPVYKYLGFFLEETKNTKKQQQ